MQPIENKRTNMTIGLWSGGNGLLNLITHFSLPRYTNSPVARGGYFSPPSFLTPGHTHTTATRQAVRQAEIMKMDANFAFNLKPDCVHSCAPSIGRERWSRLKVIVKQFCPKCNTRAAEWSKHVILLPPRCTVLYCLLVGSFAVHQQR